MFVYLSNSVLCFPIFHLFHLLSHPEHSLASHDFPNPPTYLTLFHSHQSSSPSHSLSSSPLTPSRCATSHVLSHYFKGTRRSQPLTHSGAILCSVMAHVSRWEVAGEYSRMWVSGVSSSWVISFFYLSLHKTA